MTSGLIFHRQAKLFELKKRIRAAANIHGVAVTRLIDDLDTTPRTFTEFLEGIANTHMDLVEEIRTQHLSTESELEDAPGKTASPLLGQPPGK